MNKYHVLQVIKAILGLLLIVVLAYALSNQANSGDVPSWETIRGNTILEIPSSEYGSPYPQPLSTIGWEDGIHISRDGLTLYCTYVPGDLLSWTINSADPTQFNPFSRGPDFGMDLITNPVGASSWIHSDVLYAHRETIDDEFESWELSNLSEPVFSEGGVAALDLDDVVYRAFIYTYNDKSPTFDLDIWHIADASLNPEGTGEPLPGFPHTLYTEDNPHVERISETTILLFFDSPDYPENVGGHDIWYSISEDDGESWSEPSNTSSINTDVQEHQPHLFMDADGVWYLYYSAPHSDGKLGIFRARQMEENNWDSWGEPELVIGAGNSAGVGEPTLTTNGDISFVVVYDNPSGEPYNRFEADPWFLPRE